MRRGELEIEHAFSGAWVSLSSFSSTNLLSQFDQRSEFFQRIFIPAFLGSPEGRRRLGQGSSAASMFCILTNDASGLFITALYHVRAISYQSQTFYDLPCLLSTSLLLHRGGGGGREEERNGESKPIVSIGDATATATSTQGCRRV